MKRLVFIFLFISTHLLMTAQNVSLQNIVPPSPEAAAFTKYGTYEVGPFTGRPDITIPIYEIKTRNFSVPISLSYDATGIRVDDISSWVGMNWSLLAGGMISRTVVCVPDDEGHGFLTEPAPRESSITNTSTYINYFKDLLIDPPSGLNAHDTDPDRFSFSFNGRSGNFVFKSDQSIMQIPQTSLKISFQSIGFQNSKFKIVDENGTKYLFDSLEVSNVYTTTGWNSFSSSKYMITGWYLTEMISSDGTEHIYFNYQTESAGPHRTNDFLETYGQEGSGFVYERKRYWSGMERMVGAKRLTSIVFTGGKVEFAKVQDRQDDYGSRLDEITIYSTVDNTVYTKLKSFKLKQGHYYSSGSYTNNASFSFTPITKDRYRLRLDTLELKDAGGNKISDYQFLYNSTMLPPKTSCSQDWWGYANGTSNQTLIPTATTFDGVAIGGANRSPDSASMKSGILEKIIYPTKGFTVFETEPHKFSSLTSQISTLTYGSTVYGYEGATHSQTTSFTTPSGGEFAGNGRISIFITPYPTSGLPAYNDPNDQQYASLPPQVKIKNLSTNQVTTYTSSNNADYYSAEISYTFSAGTSYEITVLCYTNYDGVMVSGTAKVDKSVPQFQTFLAGGLRIKNIKNYTADSTLANQESYIYGYGQGLGEYTGVQYLTNTRYEIKRYVATGFGTMQLDRTYYQSGFVHDQTPLQGSPVAYRLVTKCYGTPTSNTGKTVYYYGNDPLVQTYPLPAGMEIANNMGFLIKDDHWKKGNLIAQTEYKRINDTTYTPVLDVMNTYTTPQTDTSFGLLTKAKVYRPVGASYFLTDFAYADYHINTGYIQLTQSIKKEYGIDASDTLRTVNIYKYDSAHRDFNVSTITTNSKDDTLEVTKKYPFNKVALQATGSLSGAESTAIDSMIARNIISPVLEEIQKEAGLQVSRSRTQYEFINGNSIEAVNMKVQRGSNPIETRLLYTSYDSYGNLKEQQKINDVKVSYIWDYQSTYPIAEVANAASSSIAYSSFETDSLGGWSKVPGSSIISNDGVTGIRSFSGTLTKKVSLGNYTVTLWSSIYGSESVNGASGTTLITKGLFKLKEWNLNNVDSIWVVAANIDEVRLHPVNARMTTYTYKPLVGITTQCDINNRILYYEYDNLNRLARIRDQDKNILKKFSYNFTGQFANAVKSGNFTRNNCGSDSIGNTVTYTVLPESYFASTQTKADSLAQSDVTTNGQAYANQYGTCTYNMVSLTSINYTGMTGYKANYVNNSTSQQYNFNISSLSGTRTLGSVQAGTYTVTLSRPTGPVLTTFGTYNNSCSFITNFTTVATFYNVVISSGSACNGVLVDVP